MIQVISVHCQVVIGRGGNLPGYACLNVKATLLNIYLLGLLGYIRNYLYPCLCSVIVVVSFIVLQSIVYSVH